jgi:hypothetical protein
MIRKARTHKTSKAVAKIVKEEEFNAHHSVQVERRGERDVFFVWLVLMFVSVVSAHFILNFTPGTPTGYVTAAESPVENLTMLVDSFFVLFVALFVGLLGHLGISKNAY